MYITYQELVVMTACTGVTLFVLIMLFFANFTLLKENRFLKRRLQVWRKSCQNHTEVPF